MTIEIYRENIVKYGSIENAIKEGFYTVWTQDKIRKAFNFGNGTQKDFERHKDNNKTLCVFMEE